MDVNNLKKDTIYVLNKNEGIIAVFGKDDEDTLIDPIVDEVQNKEATLTFQVSAKSKKWKETYNPENLYLINNKVFSANFSDCIERERTENDEDIITLVAYERQKLLEREYVRAWNSETGFENIDEFMVVVVSGGDLELKNNDRLVPTRFEKGTSGYVLDALLYGTGWKTGICDVEGTFDLETDMENIYDNIKKVQEIWGGILVVDSLNKIIHHRDETKFLPYSGYEVKYTKNIQSNKYIGDNKIITMLCPLGEGSLNIKEVNDNSVWLTNFSYTDTILKAIENNDDIYEPEQLKRWGERKLEILSKPRKELTVTTALLKEIEGFEHEDVGLNDIVDVIDYEFIDEKTTQLRVIEYKYYVWSGADAQLELGDITLESTDILKKIPKAANLINNGTLDTSKVIDYYKNGQSLRRTLRQIDQVITDTRTELSKTDEEIKASVSQTITRVDNLNNDIVSQDEKIAELVLQVDSISSKVETLADLTETISSYNGKLILDKAIAGYLLDLSIHGYEGSFAATYLSEDTILSEDLFLLDQTIELYVRSPKDENVEPIEYNEQHFTFELDDELRILNDVYDEFVIQDNKATLIRRIGVDSQENNYILTEPKYIDYGDVTINIAEGTNYIEIAGYEPTIIARYVKQNPYTNQFATKANVKTIIEQLDDQILLVASEKLSTDELIQEFNSQIAITPQKILIEGGKIRIKSDYFELSYNGEITATKGRIAGWEINEQYLGYGEKKYGFPIVGINTQGAEDPESLVFFSGKTSLNGKPTFGVFADGTVDLQRVNIYDKSVDDRCYIHLYNESHQVGTLINSSKVETYNMIAGSGRKRGQVMHGIENTDTGHIYGCYWTNGSMLQFYVDDFFGDYVCWINAGTSDERLKHDIKEIDKNLLQAISEIKMKSYILNSDQDNKIRIGIIAQDLIAIAEKYDINIFDYFMINQQKSGYYYIDYEQIENLKIAYLEENYKKLEKKNKKYEQIIEILADKLGCLDEIKNILNE